MRPYFRSEQHIFMADVGFFIRRKKFSHHPVGQGAVSKICLMPTKKIDVVKSEIFSKIYNMAGLHQSLMQKKITAGRCYSAPQSF